MNVFGDTMALRAHIQELIAEVASLRRIALVASDRRVDLLQALRALVIAAEAQAEDVMACGCPKCTALRDAAEAGRKLIE